MGCPSNWPLSVLSRRSDHKREQHEAVGTERRRGLACWVLDARRNTDTAKRGSANEDGSEKQEGGATQRICREGSQSRGTHVVRDRVSLWQGEGRIDRLESLRGRRRRRNRGPTVRPGRALRR